MLEITIVFLSVGGRESQHKQAVEGAVAAQSRGAQVLAEGFWFTDQNGWVVRVPPHRIIQVYYRSETQVEQGPAQAEGGSDGEPHWDTFKIAQDEFREFVEEVLDEGGAGATLLISGGEVG